MSSNNYEIAKQSLLDEVRDSRAQDIEGVLCPSLDEIFLESAQLPPATEPPGMEVLSVHEQGALLQFVENTLKEAELNNGPANFEDVPGVLLKLWHGQSEFLTQATEALANGSRNPSLRPVYGQAGILKFFLELIASKEVVESNLILHCLRLIGNSCADTDENRATVVKDNYTFAILRQLQRPELIKVVIPVIYNLCVDFEPAQSQLAGNKIVYILLKLVKDNAFQGNDTLLEYVYELIELVGEQDQGVAKSPDGTISLLVACALNNESEQTLSQYCCLSNCMTAYLNNNRFQDICISKRILPDILSVLKKSLSFNTLASSDDAKALIQSQLKINQALAEVSASPVFAETYRLDDPLSQTLKSWLSNPEDQLQICACIMLGNLARSDDICVTMVKKLQIHEELIVILNSNAKGATLHSALSFLKNLAIAGDNKIFMGEAGIIPAIARLWNYETVPQVQLAATSLARQLVNHSVENISRLLQPATTSAVVNENDGERTYLSLLLALFERSDSTPILTEIGRITACLCRTIIPRSKAGDQSHLVDSILERLFTHNEGIASPLGAMVTQTQWPVVRSEGWFALALLASTKTGAEAVIDGLQKIDGFSLIEQTLSAEEPASDKETDKDQWRKDRDNIVVLVQELLKNKENKPDTVDGSWNSRVQDLMSQHVSKYLKQDK